ncbi:hypothetical protein [Companilactobacillus kimchiensis]|nr:hypothetical protein [Companilactobacillus kimchiensis]
MTTNFTGKFSDKKITIQADDLGTINYYSVEPESVDEESIFFMMRNRDIIGMNFGNADSINDPTNYLEIIVPENIIASDFFYFLTEELNQSGYSLNVDYKMTISAESTKVYQAYWKLILPLLRGFGLEIVQPKKVVAKPRHKYAKSLADVPFKINYNGSKATVYWVKRDQFVIKSGASLVAETPLTKAGIIGFAAKFGLRLRQEHETQIKDNVLISDITLRSVNEVGTFLYFAGTNGWLQLKSPEGKTLNELTVVK